MSEPQRSEAILSREELDALLAELADAKRREEERTKVFRPDAAGSRGGGDRLPVLRRVMERFAEEYGKELSSLHQTRIAWELMRWDDVELAELVGALLPVDRVVTVALEPSAELAFVWVSRPLLFAWMARAFGGRADAKAGAPPPRPFTRIEQRFLRRVVATTLSRLDQFVGELVPWHSKVLAVEEPRALLDGGDRALLVGFDVRGFGDIGRVRLLLPFSPFEKLELPSKRAESRPRPNVEGVLLDTPVTLRAEVGGAELSLADVAALRVGTLIPIEAPADGSLVLKVEGTPKFRGLRGRMGGRLAVQILEACKHGG